MKRNKSYDNKQPLLYLVATPIGNLKDISTRALEVLSESDFIACEDTRNTKSLLDKYGIKKELFSLREHNEAQASEHVISLLKEGKKVCYVSDAGYPGISDPGKMLAIKCRNEDISVSVISGSNAALVALVASSLPSNHFYFHGFLSAVDGEAKEELKTLKNKKETMIFYEAPHRIKRTLKLFMEAFGENRKATLARELTKLNEEYIEGTLKELNDIDESTLIGEFVVVIEGNNEEVSVSDKELLERSKYLLKKNIRTKDVADIVSFEFNVNKNYVYQLIIDNKD